jgi:hypothetical protein
VFKRLIKKYECPDDSNCYVSMQHSHAKSCGRVPVNRPACRLFARRLNVPVKNSLFLQTPSILLGVLILQILLFPLAIVQAGEIRDPMQPPAFALKKFQQAKYKNRVGPVNPGIKVKKPAAKPLKLTSILYSPTRKIAIIDDQMLAVGGTIRGARVVKINKYSARLVRKGKVINLRLPDESIGIKKTLVESKI